MPVVNLNIGITTQLKPIQFLKDSTNTTIQSSDIAVETQIKKHDSLIVQKYAISTEELKHLPIVLSNYDKETIIEPIPLQYVGKIHMATKELTTTNTAEQSAAEYARTINILRISGDRPRKHDPNGPYNLNEMKDIARKLGVKLTNNLSKESIALILKSKIESLI